MPLFLELTVLLTQLCGFELGYFGAAKRSLCPQFDDSLPKRPQRGRLPYAVTNAFAVVSPFGTCCSVDAGGRVRAQIRFPWAVAVDVLVQIRRAAAATLQTQKFKMFHI